MDWDYPALMHLNSRGVLVFYFGLMIIEAIPEFMIKEEWNVRIGRGSIPLTPIELNLSVDDDSR